MPTVTDSIWNRAGRQPQATRPQQSAPCEFTGQRAPHVQPPQAPVFYTSNSRQPSYRGAVWLVFSGSKPASAAVADQASVAASTLHPPPPPAFAHHTQAAHAAHSHAHSHFPSAPRHKWALQRRARSRCLSQHGSLRPASAGAPLTSPSSGSPMT